MKVKELIEELKDYEDFDIQFTFTDGVTDMFLSVRSFENIEITDIGYSEKIIQLGGDEDK